MANQLSKFTPNLAQITQPLCELLSKSRNWSWEPSQSKAFDLVKEELAKPTTLALYDPAAVTKASADASTYGLGAVATTTENRQSLETCCLCVSFNE